MTFPLFISVMSMAVLMATSAHAAPQSACQIAFESFTSTVHHQHRADNASSVPHPMSVVRELADLANSILQARADGNHDVGDLLYTLYDKAFRRAKQLGIDVTRYRELPSEQMDVASDSAAPERLGRKQRARNLLAKLSPWSKRTLFESTSSDGFPNAVALSNDGRWLSVGLTGGLTHVFDLREEKRLYGIPEPDNAGVKLVNFSSDSTKLLLLDDADAATIYEVNDPNIQVHLKPTWQRAGSDSFKFAGFSPDGKRIMLLTKKRHYLVFDAITGNEIFPGSRSRLRKDVLAISKDGSKILADSNEGLVILDTKTEAVIASLEKSKAGDIVALDFAFSADGSVVATRRLHSYQMAAWATETGRALQTFGEQQPPSEAKFFIGPDGTRIATISKVGGVLSHILNAKTGAPLLLTVGGAATDFTLTNAEFSSDGEYIVTTSTDGKSRLWHLNPGAFIQTLDLDAAKAFHRHVIVRPGLIITITNDWVVDVWRRQSDLDNEREAKKGSALR